MGWIKKNWAQALWMLLLVGGTAGILVWMQPCLREGQCRGGTSEGILAGRVGFLFILSTMAYLFRKNRPRFMVAPLQQWLFAHVILGTLSLALIMAHSGFHLRNNVAALAFLFLAITVVSGVVGLFIVYFKPRAQARTEAAVLIPDDLCLRISQLHEEISELCSEKGGVFLDVYNELAIPVYNTDVGKEPPSADVSPWADGIGEDDGEPFMNLAAKVEEVHDLFVLLGRHMRFRWWIRGWLLLHVPSTIGLIVFSFAHIISVHWFQVQ